MKETRALSGRALVMLSVAVTLAMPAWADPLDTVAKVQTQVTHASVKSQKRIDKISEATDAMLEAYRLENQRIDGLEVYNAQLETLIASQEAEMASLLEQIENVTLVEREITPLMQRMLDSLEAFVELDIPFLLDERRERVAKLRDMMDRSDVTVTEKFRRLLEAYQVENDYGSSIDSYRGEIELEGSPHTVDFLSVGRVALLYQTLDGEISGEWDPIAGEWKPLDSSFNKSIRRGIRIALKQESPNLLQLPIRAPEVAR